MSSFCCDAVDPSFVIVSLFGRLVSIFIDFELELLENL